MSIAELAAATGIGRQITHRLVNTLVEAGYVVRDERSARYRLGLEAIYLAHQAVDNIALRTLAMPFMTDLARTSGMTINLNVFDRLNHTVLCVESVDGADKARYNMHAGSQGALHVGASRKVILACLTDDEVTRTLDAVATFTDEDRARVRKELATIREQGFAITRGESVARGVGCAVALFEPRSQTFGSLSALGQVSQVTDAQIQSVTDDLVLIARRINARSAARTNGDDA